MDIHAIICTRSSKDVSEVTDKLVTFLSRCKINVFLISGAKSIFTAYQNAFNKINPADDDLVILCHDDIEIRDTPEDFIAKLKRTLNKSWPWVGFVGPAGTTHLGDSAVWWDQKLWKEGKHRGKVSHMDPLGHEYVTRYGSPDEVVVLDGLFLAATAKCIKQVGLQKPSYFEGEWDFYDIHYTSKAHNMGFVNKILDIDILHHSRGELVGRDSWHKNREAFIRNTVLPINLNEY